MVDFIADAAVWLAPLSPSPSCTRLIQRTNELHAKLCMRTRRLNTPEATALLLAALGSLRGAVDMAVFTDAPKIARCKVYRSTIDMWLNELEESGRARPKP